jgi:hemerythrin
MKDKNFQLIKWSSKLECGVKLIDDQHRDLVELVNEMYNHASGNFVQEHDYFHRVIKEMVKYVKIHFATEEKIMLALKFAGYEEHKKEHESLIVAIINNARDYETGKRLTLSSFTRLLKDWVMSHIAIMDKQYFEYFRKIATRKADGKLSITSLDIEKVS